MPLDNSSSFRRSGQRDDRRRRLLTDDLSDAGGTPACCAWPGDAPPRKSEHYGDAEFLEQQLRLLDLIPRRMVGLVLVLLVATAILAGLEVSYAWMLDRKADGGAMATMLDLTAKGSLACWFSSLMLLAASATAMLVHGVRRHRTDDYQGRYRVWLWAAACCFFMATDEAASLREGFRDLMIGLTGTPLLDDGTLWWAIPYAFAWGAVGSRLLIDMRSDRLSVGALLVAAIAHTLAVAGWLGWIFPQGNSRDMMFLVGFEMGGNLALLAAMTLYARHVILDAEGLLPRRALQPDEGLIDEEGPARTAKLPSPAANRWRKIDPPHTPGQPAFQRVAASTATASESASSSEPSAVHRKLTKAERKALKQRLLRERLERQRRAM